MAFYVALCRSLGIILWEVAAQQLPWKDVRDMQVQMLVRWGAVGVGGWLCLLIHIQPSPTQVSGGVLIIITIFVVVLPA